MPKVYYVKTKTNSTHKWQDNTCHDSIWKNTAVLSIYGYEVGMLEEEGGLLTHTILHVNFLTSMY